MGNQALFLYADREEESNTSYFRIAIPAKYLNKKGDEITVASIRGFSYQNLPKVVLVERLIFPELVHKLRRGGVEKVFATFDDAYHIMPEHAGTKSYWSAERLDMFRAGLRECDGVMVPNHLLMDDFGKGVKMIFVPNYLDDDAWPAIELPDREVVVIGWGGSLGHARTWEKSNLLPALIALREKYGDKVMYNFVGRIPPAIADSGLPASFGTWTPFEGWSNVVRSWRIGLAPLAGAYDRRRSTLKIEEYGAAGIPMVASDEGEYALSKPEGCFLVKDRVNDWVDALSKLIEDDNRRTTMGRMSRAWGERYLMGSNTEVYDDVLFS
jgi:hypothetical protein